MALGATLLMMGTTAGMGRADQGRHAGWGQAGGNGNARASGGWAFRGNGSQAPRGGPARGVESRSYTPSSGWSGNARTSPQSGWGTRGPAGGRAPSSGWSYGGTTRYRNDGGDRYVPRYRYYPRYAYYPRYGYYRPHRYVRFGIDFGYPGYYARPVYVRPVTQVVFTNLPPADCYYYDPYCDMRFDCLDDYIDHLDDYDHEPILEVIGPDGSCRSTYGYFHGEWSIAN